VASFVFATCLVGMETALKREIARTRPDLKLAFSRPGLVTFKSPRDDESEWDSVFARVWGRSIGPVATPDDIRTHYGRAAGTFDRVHVFARDPEQPTDLAPWQIGPGGEAQIGELVADVIVHPEGGAWLGTHRHDATRSPHAGGSWLVEVPADAPSRAYAKIEEAIAWAKLPVAAGQTALEIGAAPGGAVMALAKRGLTVYGVDTGELAPAVRALPGVVHLQKTVGALRWEELPPRVDWLLVDVNLAPQVALHEVARLMPPLKSTLRGAVFTLKLNDPSFVDELPILVDRIRRMGLPEVGLRHLPSNRREVCAVGRVA
jgi:23S rRNA (cytidine2498-2'-O)-methyltransferase